MQHHMVQHTSKGISCFAFRISNSGFNSFTDGNAKAPRRIRRFGQYIPACLRFLAGTGKTTGAISLHDQFPVWFLVKTYSHHKNFAFQSNQ